jgi:predicted ATPase/class 3 adenylate cyclase
MIQVSMRPDLPTGTVTFLFTDVEGSTKLLEEIGDEAYDEALADHRRIVREACAEHAGVEVDTQGDAFFFAFSTAPAALAAASTMTPALAPGPIRVRIGLHTGEPRVSDEGYVGKEVHFAARVAATGHGGQIVISKATAELVDVQLSDLGEHRLKDIEGAVCIYQLGDERFPPLKTVSNTNLPRPASSFVGREHELEAVLALIEEGARLVTLTGPGGSGKTRLALEAASTLVPEYKAGVFWVGLAALRDPALVTETIAQTLGEKDGLAEHIGEREMLLLLDNLEQVVESAPELASLLQGCPNLTLLVTSRELLRVQGEVEYEVPPLQEPEAVSLFQERSQLEPSDEIAELCRRLDSLPLAVELAAARTKALSPKQILERLSQRLDLLKGGRDADPRQQTLRATIEWSYDLLSEEEQRLFRFLSVFSGGCTLEAAEEVCDADLDTLQSLVEKSLLRFSNERYWMLETIREYAAGRLEESGTVDELSRRCARFFVALVEVAQPHLTGPTQAAWLERLHAEHANFRRVLQWLGERREAELQLRMVAALWRFWHLHGFLGEGRGWLREALQGRDGVPTIARGNALLGAGVLAHWQHDRPEVKACANEAVKLFRDLGDRRGLASALRLAAMALEDEGRFEGARRLREESLEISRDLGDERDIAVALAGLATVARTEGDYERAQRLWKDSLPLFRQSGDRYGLAISLFGLAFAAVDEQREDDAERYLAEALSLSQELEYEEGIAYYLLGAAALALARGESHRGVQLLGRMDVLCDEIAFSMNATERELRERTLAAARASLGESVVERALAEGGVRSMASMLGQGAEIGRTR